MKNSVFILVLLCLGFVSCNNESSLQEFYVAHQNDNQYMAFDIPVSLLTGDNSALTAEQKATMETIKKVNILGFPLKGENKGEYEAEKERLTSILKADKYQQLMRYGGGTRKAELYYLGEEDAIDELIVFGSDDEKGFGIARLTGNDMNPEDLIRLLKSFEKGELNLAGFPKLEGFLD